MSVSDPISDIPSGDVPGLRSLPGGYARSQVSSGIGVCPETDGYTQRVDMSTAWVFIPTTPSIPLDMGPGRYSRGADI